MTDQAAGYQKKFPSYFENARKDYVDLLPISSTAAILELGCGNGATGALALAEHKCGKYVGIELFEPMGREAAKVLSAVHIGNVEQMALPYPDEAFDVLILSEVLEHLIDPAAALRKLVRLVKQGGRVLASSPNISHRSVVKALKEGEFRYTERGLMDSTHLRWFTPRSFRELFEGAGVQADWMGPVGWLSWKARLISRMRPSRAHLFWYQINFHGHRVS